MPINIKRSITVKAVVTQELKSQLGAELQAALASIEADLARLRGGQSHQDDGDGRQAPVSAEIQKRQTQKEQVLVKLRELARLELGTEITQGTVEGQVEVKAGDDWSRLFRAELVLKDGMVVAVRE